MRNRVFVVVALAAAFAGVSGAQVTARLSGSVEDSSGLAVPGATVDILLQGGAKPILTATTTPEGIFAFTAIPANTYEVVVTAKGFRKATVSGVLLTAGEETSMPPVRLEVGSTTEVVEVKENAETLQTTNSEISTNVGKQQVKDLPILSRSPQGFVDTQAGVNLSRGGDSVVNGQRTSFTNVTLDGINIQDNYIRTNAVDFSPNLLLVDQVSEFTISTSNTNPAGRRRSVAGDVCDSLGRRTACMAAASGRTVTARSPPMPGSTIRREWPSHFSTRTRPAAISAATSRKTNCFITAITSCSC